MAVFRLFTRICVQSEAAGNGLFVRSSLHSTAIQHAGGNWREQRGMSRTGTSYGPLTDLPDWSYLDGQPAPSTLSKRQLKRKKKQNAIGRRIKYLLKEVDLAKMQSEKNNLDSDENNEQINNY